MRGLFGSAEPRENIGTRTQLERIGHVGAVDLVGARSPRVDIFDRWCDLNGLIHREPAHEVEHQSREVIGTEQVVTLKELREVAGNLKEAVAAILHRQPCGRPESNR